jgi:hypothetical protein
MNLFKSKIAGRTMVARKVDTKVQLKQTTRLCQLHTLPCQSNSSPRHLLNSHLIGIDIRLCAQTAREHHLIV